MFHDYIDLMGIISTIAPLIFAILLIPKKGPKAPFKDPVTYAILALNVIFTMLLPLQLYQEFPKSSDSRYADYTFYFRHYPHITIFPTLFFGLAVLFVLRAFYIWRERAPSRLRWRVVFAIAMAMSVTYWEVGGRQMMLFEFNKQAQSATGPFNPDQILEKAKAVGLANAFDPAATLGQQVMVGVNNGLSPSKAAAQRMDELLNYYGAWNELGVQWRSKSRAIYLVLFSYMTFVMFLGFALSAFLPKTDEPKRVREVPDAKISVNLLGAFFVFLLWMPFRIFSNVNTKIPLFGGENIYDNFFGRLPLTSRFGFTPADIVPVLVITIFSTLLILRIRRISRKKTIIFLSACSVLLVVGIAVLARENSEVFLELFGITGDLKGLVLRLLLASVLTVLLYQFVGSIPVNIEDTGLKGKHRLGKLVARALSHHHSLGEHWHERPLGIIILGVISGLVLILIMFLFDMIRNALFGTY